MEAITLSSTRREGTGKGPNRRLRAENRVPAVVYGHGVASALNIAVDPKELLKALGNPKGLNAVIDLSLDGDTKAVMIREVQRNPLSRAVIHVDFVVPDPAREIEADVPFETTGNSPGVQAGGKLRIPQRTVRVRSLPRDVPAKVVGDVSSLELDDNLMISQLVLPEGVKAVFDRDIPVVKVMLPRGGQEGAAEGAAPAEGAAEAAASKA